MANWYESRLESPSRILSYNKGKGSFRLLGIILTLTLFLAIQGPVSAELSTTITVTTENDIFDGDTHSPETLQQFPGRDQEISLREAIETANQSPEQVTILFESSHDTMTLTITSPLPPIREPLIIDASTPNSPHVELQGPGQSSTPVINGLTLTGSTITIRGLSITKFPGAGIVIQGSNNTIEHSYVGTNPFGTPDKGNGGTGITISGNGHVVGGSTPDSRNVISGNLGHGVEVLEGSKNHIRGNLIGVSPVHHSALPNAKDGIIVSSPHNVIGGRNPLEINVISGNGKNGLHLEPSAHHTVIQGNIVGIDSSLHHIVPNNEDGIFVKSQDNLIGGTEPGSGNIIGGSKQSGIEIHQGHNNRIQGNMIGTNRDGQANWGNTLEGIAIFANGTQVGGIDPAAANQIAFNQRGGIAIPFGRSNTVRGNAIYSNVGLAINLQQDDLTANDPLDKDQGPNELQNFPELSMATARSANDLLVAGRFNSQPEQTYQLDFYGGRPEGPLRYQEAFSYLGSSTITTNAEGENTFSIHLSTFVSPGRYITATATNSDGNTSELAQSALVERPNPKILWASAPHSINNQVPFEVSYTEGMAAVKLVPTTAKIIDVDSQELSTLTVRLSNPRDGDDEILMATLPSQDLSQSYIHSTLTITGKAPVAMYEQALHSLTYRNRSTAPSSTPRLLTMVVSDGEYTSQPFTTRLTIGGVNNPPTIHWQPVSSGEHEKTYVTSYKEGRSAIPIVPPHTILTDSDSPHLSGLTITLQNPLDGEHEILQSALTDSTMTQTFSNGVLTISGSASPEAYQNVMRSVTYENHSPTPNTTPRTITIVSSDGALTSEPHTTQVHLVPNNTPPTIIGNVPNTSHLPLFTEGDSSLAFVSQDWQIHDTDSQEFTELKVSLDNPLDGDQEILSAELNHAALTQRYTQGTLTVTGNAPKSTYESVLQSLRYFNHQASPTEGNRDLQVTIQDSQGGTSQPQLIQIAVEARPVVPPSFAPSFIASLDSVAEVVAAETQQQRHNTQLVVKTVTGSGLMVSAGIFIWVLRGTSILASLLATIPAWSSIDPLPILSMSQEDRWQHFVDTALVETQEQQEFPQFKEIFSDQQSESSHSGQDSDKA